MKGSGNRLAQDVKSLRQDRYSCQKHGDQGSIGIQFTWPDGASKNYCFECYHEMIATHCCELTEIPAPAAPLMPEFDPVTPRDRRQKKAG